MLGVKYLPILLLIGWVSAIDAQQLPVAKQQKVYDTIELDGVVEAVQQSTVSAQTSGTIVKLPVDVDDAVAAGELIVQLDSTEQRAQLNQAQANLTSAQASLKDAERRVQRITNLFQQQVASQAELDEAETQLDTRQAAVDAATAALEESRKQLSYTEVRAPYAGIVTERFVELGESVQAGQRLMAGLSLEQLRVVTDLPQRFADYVRRHPNAVIVTDANDQLPADKLTFYPYADKRTHSFRLRLTINDKKDQLLPGMATKVRLTVGERQALLIPQSTVVVKGEFNAVYVRAENGKSQLRLVRLGRQYQDEIEVLAGLEAGEQLVVAAKE